MTDEKISISRGNTKVGRIPSISLPPFVTCAPRVPCSLPDYADKMKIPCYARKAYIQYPATRDAWNRNLRIWNTDGARYFAQLYAFLTRRAPRFFRFHVSGDYPSHYYFRGTVDTASAFPSTRFLAFTKRHRMLPRADALPENYTVVASQWPSGKWTEMLKPETLRARGYFSAFVDDGTETRAPLDALQCPGNCETCGACWELPKLQRDVIFPKH